MIFNFWPAWFRALHGGSWPRDYCAIDVETTGFAFDRDVITEWGHCLVEGGKVVDRLSLVIDWTDHAVVPDHWLRSQLQIVQESMARDGKPYHITYERMRKEGMKPLQALAFIAKFTAAVRARGMLFVAHNATFEEKMLCANFAGFGASEAGFSFGANGFFDTDCLEKANQRPDQPRFHPRKGDTLKSYFHRVKYTRLEGVKSNLDGHCAAKYKFQEVHGIAPGDMHGAMVDSYCTHLLMQEFGKLVLPEIQQSPCFPDADHKEMRKTGSAVAPPPLLLPMTRRIRGQRNS